MSCVAARRPPSRSPLQFQLQPRRQALAPVARQVRNLPSSAYLHNIEIWQTVGKDIAIVDQSGII